jgi:hypothetical protein
MTPVNPRHSSHYRGSSCRSLTDVYYCADKVALATPQLLTILDVDTDTWYSTMKILFQKTARCLTFSRSGQILFVTTEESIYVSIKYSILPPIYR